jgi:plasmid stabilization system protein ParE
MVKVNWTDSAIIDLNEIGEFISKDSERHAQLTVDRLFNSVDILEDHPRSGEMVSEFQDEKIRELIRLNYKLKIRNSQASNI